MVLIDANTQVINAKDLREKLTPVISGDKLVIVDSENSGKTSLVDPALFKWEPGEPGAKGNTWNPGAKWDPGKSAYQVWLDNWNSGTVDQYLNSLVGAKGDPGVATNWTNWKSAYQLWLQAWNTGTLQDFLTDIQGEKWDPGEDGVTFDYRGDYDPGASYDTGFVVLFNWASYVSRIDGNTSLPTHISWWKIAEAGKDGEGVGDMLKSENLEGLWDYAIARAFLQVDSSSEVDAKIAGVTIDAYTKSESDAKYSVTTHNHTLASLTEKSYNSLTDKPDFSIYEVKSAKWQANGYAPLDANGLISSGYLPSFVDDIIEVANFAALPGSGETGKMYVTLDDGKLYRWWGSAYSAVSSNNMSDANATTLVSGWNADSLHTHAWSVITGKPTTISGYGITNAYTKTEVDGFLTAKANLSGALFTWDVIVDSAFYLDNSTYINPWSATLNRSLFNMWTESSGQFKRNLDISVRGSAAWWVWWSQIRFWTNPVDSDTPIVRMCIKRDGWIWYWTENPINPFEFKHIWEEFQAITINSSNANDGTWIYMRTLSEGRISVWDLADMTFCTSRVIERMRILNNGNVWFWLSNAVSLWHFYQNNAEVWSGAGVTIEQDGTWDAVLQILRTWIVRWKVWSPNDNNFAISNWPLTSPLLLLKTSWELQTRRLAYRHSNWTPRYSFDQFWSDGVSDRMYISMYNSSWTWLWNPIEIDNFDSWTKQIRLWYQVKLSTTNTPTSSSGLPAWTIWSDNGTLKMA